MQSSGGVVGAGSRAFRNQATVVAGVVPVIGFVLVADRAQAGPGTVVGTALVLAALVAAAAAPRSWGDRWFALVLTLDVVALAVVRSEIPSVGISALFALPALWAGYTFGLVGAGAVTAFVTAVLWIGAPGEWDSVTGQDAARLIAFPLVTAAVSGTAAVLSRRASAAQQLLADQAVLLRGQLDAISRRERLVRAVFDSVDFDVVAFDGDGSVTIANVRRRPGSLETAVEPAAREAVAAAIARTLAGEELEDEIVTVRSEIGPSRSYAVSTRQFTESDGAAGGVLIARDVTAEREAIAARDDLVAAVSHELRTPTTAILGSVELARESDELPGDAARLLDVAARNAERLVELVNGILQAAREDRVDLVLGPCDLVDLIDATLESADPAARAADVRLGRTAATPDSLVVTADAFRIRQVLDNLVSNAVKYNRPGGSVEVGVDVFDGRAWLIVRDDGIGIADADQERLFERFFRAEAVRSSAVHGTGLGLAICRQIVRRHGGDLSITSALGEGTTATAVLPVAGPDGGEGTR